MIKRFVRIFAVTALALTPMLTASAGHITRERLVRLLAEYENRTKNSLKAAANVALDDQTVKTFVVRGEITQTLLDEIAKLGATVKKSLPKYRYVRVSATEAIAAKIRLLKGVKSVGEPLPPTLNKVNTSEGDVAHKAAAARTDFGVTGKGVKVGVISDSARYLEDLQNSGDLPKTGVTVLKGYEGEEISTGEGTGMMEIVYDLAPGAELFFATGHPTHYELADAVEALEKAGCRIIVDDISYDTEPALQESYAVKAINDFVSRGGFYFSCAINYGNKASNTSSVWEGDFVEDDIVGTNTLDGVDYVFQRFDADNNTCDLLSHWGSGDELLYLQWNDDFYEVENEYRILVDNPNVAYYLEGYNEDMASSPFLYLTQAGFVIQSRSAATSMVGSSVLIAKRVGAPDRHLRLVFKKGQISPSTNGATWGHCAAGKAFTVASVSANGKTSAFSGGESVELTSADGPRRIFRDVNGAILKDGLLAANAVSHEKVDFTASDDTLSKWMTLHYGKTTFTGTSAAAPHAAAIAALMLEANPNLTRDDMMEIFKKSTFSSSGWNPTKGYGILNAYACVENARYFGVDKSVFDDVEISNVDAKGVAVKKVALTGDRAWTATASAEWIDLYVRAFAGNGNFEFGIDENYTGQERTATITLTSGEFTKTITVTQKGKKIVSLTSGTVTIDTGKVGESNPSFKISGGETYTGTDDGSGIATFTFDYLYLGKKVTVNISGNRPLILKSNTDMKIETNLDVSGSLVGRCGGGVGGKGDTAQNGGDGGDGGNGGSGGGGGGNDGHIYAFASSRDLEYAAGNQGFCGGAGKGGKEGECGTSGQSASLAFGVTTAARGGVSGNGGDGGSEVPLSAGGEGGNATAGSATSYYLGSKSVSVTEMNGGTGGNGDSAKAGNNGGCGEAGDRGADAMNDMSGSLSDLSLIGGGGGGGGGAGGGGGGGSGGAGGGGGGGGSGIPPRYKYFYFGSSYGYTVGGYASLVDSKYVNQSKVVDLTHALPGNSGLTGISGTNGGNGGNGGCGGDGGNGGGAIMLTANGALLLAGTVDISSWYDDDLIVGGTGSDGTKVDGPTSTPASSSKNWKTGVPNGGRGGNGGKGGNGGAGGNGGCGGYGAPGMVKFCGMEILAKGSIVQADNGDKSTDDSRCGGVTFATRMTDSALDAQKPTLPNTVLVGNFTRASVLYLGQLKTVHAAGCGVCAEDNYAWSLVKDLVAEDVIGGKYELRRLKNFYNNYEQLFLRNVSGGPVVSDYVKIGDSQTYHIENLLAGEIWTALGSYCKSGETVTAGEMYTVTCRVGTIGAGFLETLYAAKGGSCRLPGALFTRQGYVQGGWSTDKDGVKKAYDLGATVTPTSDMTLYPYWTPISYSIAYALDNGTAGGSYPETATFDAAFSIAAPTRAGCRFTGWTVSAGLDASFAKYGNSASPVTAILAANQKCLNGESGAVWFKNLTATYKGKVTLRANWEPLDYTITFDSAGGSAVAPITVKFGELIVLPDDPVLTGHHLTGWYREGESTAFHAVTMPAESFTLTAHWAANVYKIHYNANNGTEDELVSSGTFGEDVSIAGSSFSHPGYTFAGWSTNAVSKGVVDYVPGQKVRNLVESGEITLYAVWQPIMYTLVYANGGGVGNAFSVQLKFNEQHTVEASRFTKEKFYFSGWKNLATGATYRAGDIVAGLTTEAGGTVTLTAQWTATVYKLTLDPAGGGWPNPEGGIYLEKSISDVADVKISPPSDPVRAGYTFIGWYRDGESACYEFTTMPAENFTLTARWRAIRYQISYDLKGGENSPDNPETYTVEDLPITLKSPTHPLGVAFAGWQPGGVIAKDTTGNLGLTASWGSITVRGMTIQDGVLVEWGGTEYGYDIEIPDFVTEIADGVFAGSAITSVVFPPSLRKIGKGAFARCFDLTWIVIPAGVEEICDQAFYLCTSIEEITFEGGVRIIGNRAFLRCSPLSIELKPGVECIGDWAFAAAESNGGTHSNLRSVDMPATVTNLGESVFAKWKAVSGANVPVNLLRMNELFPDSFATIASSIVPDGETVVTEGMFDGCSALKTVELPDGLLEIGSLAFRKCTSLREISIPDDVQVIGSGAFNGCKSLSRVSLPSGLTAVESGLFTGCTSLTSVVIPANVASVSDGVWPSSVKSVYYLGNAPTATDSVYASASSALTTYVVDGSRGWDGYAGSRGEPDDSMWHKRAWKRWTAVKLIASFDGNGGTPELTEREQFSDDAYAFPLENPTRNGFTFNGWWTHRTSGGQILATDKVTGTRNQTLYAHWNANVNTVNVTFNACGGTVEPESRLYGATLTYESFPVPTWRGHAFRYWASSENGANPVFESDAVPSVATQLFAQWNENTYAVMFHANNGTDDFVVQRFTYGKSARLAANTFSYPNHNFIGWANPDNGAVAYANRASVVNLSEINDAVVHLYAKWSGACKTIRFDGNTGSGSMEPQTFSDGVADALNANAFVKSGYRFVGWARTSNGDVEFLDRERVSDVSNIDVLYAKWTLSSRVTTALVLDYNDGSGSTMSTVRTKSEDTYGNLSTPQRKGYTFTGWHLGSEEGATVSANSIVGSSSVQVNSLLGESSANVEDSIATCTLVAGWKYVGESYAGETVETHEIPEGCYAVEFEGASLSVATVQDWTHGKVYTLPSPTVKKQAKKRFSGWQCSNGKRYDDGMLVFNLAEPGETVTMTAIWE